MGKVCFVLFALVVSFLSGCMSTPVPPADCRVTIAPNLGRDLHVTDVRCVKNASGIMTMQANVVNNTGSQLRVQWRVQWLDADGMEIDSLVSTWGDVAVQPYDISGLKGTAPGASAADMRLYIREMP